ncbi:DUF4190 domain-containing protein [bacterium AH-315-M10]|nr:DUF4190 domain-containing protein [bacterium AH-315-M10]
MKLAGKRGRCPKCREKIDVPDPDDDLPILEAAGDTGEVEALTPSSRQVRPSSRARVHRPSSRARVHRPKVENPETQASADKMADQAFILALCSIVCAFFTGIPALIFGLMALRQHRSGVTLTNPWKAQIGVGLGGVASSLGLAFVFPALGIVVSLVGLAGAIASFLHNPTRSWIEERVPLSDGRTQQVAIGAVVIFTLTLGAGGMGFSAKRDQAKAEERVAELTVEAEALAAKGKLEEAISVLKEAVAQDLAEDKVKAENLLVRYQAMAEEQRWWHQASLDEAKAVKLLAAARRGQAATQRARGLARAAVPVRVRELAYIKLLIAKAGYSLYNESKIDGEAGSGMVAVHILHMKKDGTLYLAMVAVFQDRAEALRRGWKLIQMPEVAVVVGHCMVSTFMADQIKEVERFPLSKLLPSHPGPVQNAPFQVVIPLGEPRAKKQAHQHDAKEPGKRVVPKKEDEQVANELVQLAKKLPEFDPSSIVQYPARFKKIDWKARINSAARMIRKIPAARGQVLKFRCPSCRASVTAKAYQAGSGATCSDCNSYLMVPSRRHWTNLHRGVVDYLRGRKKSPPMSSRSLRNSGKGAISAEVRAGKMLGDLVADYDAVRFIRTTEKKLAVWKAEWSEARKRFVARARQSGATSRREKSMNRLVDELRQLLKETTEGGLTVNMRGFNTFLASSRRIVTEWNRKARKAAAGRIKIHARVWAPTDPPYLVIKNLNRFTLTACVVTINGTHTYWPNKPDLVPGDEEDLRLDYFRNRQGRSFWPVGTITRIEVRSNQGVWHGELGR